jgi:penicillin amidase
MKAIQADVYSIPLAQLQKYVVAINPEGFLQERALEHVKAWDGRLTTDTVGGTILAVTLEKLVSNLFSPALGNGSLLNGYASAVDYNRRAVLALLAQPGSTWWGTEGREAMLKKAFAEAVDSLGNRYGDAPADWHWGRLHTATFDHPLGSVQPLDRLFNAGPVAAPGGVNTVFATSYDPSLSFDVDSLSSMRMIVDLSNLGNSLQIHTTGQSGQPLDKHYSDMVLLWRDVQYSPMYFDRAALDRVREGSLVLAP